MGNRQSLCRDASVERHQYDVRDVHSLPGTILGRVVTIITGD